MKVFKEVMFVRTHLIKQKVLKVHYYLPTISCSVNTRILIQLILQEGVGSDENIITEINFSTLSN